MRFEILDIKGSISFVVESGDTRIKTWPLTEMQRAKLAVQLIDTASELLRHVDLNQLKKEA